MNVKLLKSEIRGGKKQISFKIDEANYNFLDFLKKAIVSTMEEFGDVSDINITYTDVLQGILMELGSANKPFISIDCNVTNKKEYSIVQKWGIENIDKLNLTAREFICRYIEKKAIIGVNNFMETKGIQENFDEKLFGLLEPIYESLQGYLDDKIEGLENIEAQKVEENANDEEVGKDANDEKAEEDVNGEKTEENVNGEKTEENANTEKAEENKENKELSAEEIRKLVYIYYNNIYEKLEYAFDFINNSDDYNATEEQINEMEEIIANFHNEPEDTEEFKSNLFEEFKIEVINELDLTDIIELDLKDSGYFEADKGIRVLNKLCATYLYDICYSNIVDMKGEKVAGNELERFLNVSYEEKANYKLAIPGTKFYVEPESIFGII